MLNLSTIGLLLCAPLGGSTDKTHVLGQEGEITSTSCSGLSNENVVWTALKNKVFLRRLGCWGTSCSLNHISVIPVPCDLCGVVKD